MSGWERPYDGWRWILQSGSVIAAYSTGNGYPVRPEDDLGVLEIMRALKRHL